MADKSVCQIPGCRNGGKLRRGWCASHYMRWWKYGDPNGGRTGHGEPEKFLREIALVYDGDECLIWPYTRSHGYAQMYRDGRMQVVPRLICEETIGPPPSPDHEAAHSCGQGHLGCVTKRHLRWDTHAGNHADRFGHGTSNRGEAHGNSKLTLASVLAIKRLLRDGALTHREIGEQFAVTRETISAIHRGKLWSWVAEPDQGIAS